MASAGRESRRDLVVVGIAWLVTTVVVEWWAVTTTIHPLGISREAEIVDEAFDLLLYLGLPVFTFVLVMLGYSLWRFRARDEAEDGAGIRTDRRFVAAWIIVSSFLAVYVIFNPGFSGLAALEEDRNADLTIEVVASQWSWAYTYVDDGFTVEKADELVLPVDTRIRFLVTSEDVIHSFWIPAFRIKVDAVPGTTSETWTTPTELTEVQDPLIRIQCAELCGTGHARMRTDLRVLEQAEFVQWVAEMQQLDEAA